MPSVVRSSQLLLPTLRQAPGGSGTSVEGWRSFVSTRWLSVRAERLLDRGGDAERGVFRQRRLEPQGQRALFPQQDVAGQTGAFR